MVYTSENSDYILIIGTTYKNGNGDLWLIKANLENEGSVEFENIFNDGNMDGAEKILNNQANTDPNPKNLIEDKTYIEEAKILLKEKF